MPVTDDDLDAADRKRVEGAAQLDSRRAEVPFNTTLMAVGLSVSLAFSALNNTIEGDNIAPLGGVFAGCSIVVIASIRLFWNRHRLRKLEGQAVELELTYRRLEREAERESSLALPAPPVRRRWWKQ